jgi:hypothetical protein
MIQPDSSLFEVVVRGAWGTDLRIGHVQISVPLQTSTDRGLVDFRWLGSNPKLPPPIDGFNGIRRVGNFELFETGTLTRLSNFDPPITVKVEYDSEDWRAASKTSYGRLSLAYFDDRRTDGRWIRFGEDGNQFVVDGNENGGILVATLSHWGGCEMECGG